VFTSALEGQRITNILEMVVKIAEQATKHVSTSELNRCIEQAKQDHPPSGGRGGKFPKIYYATQTEVKPVTFTIFVNDPSIFHFSYLRYLERKLREQFGFDGVFVKLILKARSVREDLDPKRKKKPGRKPRRKGGR
jgi:GTP-binding protein